MLTWFRRQRLVAALMILANPALVGSWVAAYHPCPVSDGAEWQSGAGTEQVALVASEQMGHEGMDMGAEVAPADHSTGHDHSQNDGHCSCIGQCLTGGIALPSVAREETRVTVTISQSAVRSTQSALASPASAQLDLLPPSTAPPTA